jgi:hypothetical protein
LDVVDPSEFVHVWVGEALGWVAVDAVGPRALVDHVTRDHPHAAVALEPGTEGEHEHPVPYLEPSLGLHVGQHVPEAAGRRVPPPVQRHLGRLDVVVVEPEVLLDGLNHGGPAGVEAEVVDAGPKVDRRGGRVGPVAAEESLHEEVQSEAHELGGGQDPWREGAEVDREGAHGGLGQRLAEGHPDAAVGVLALPRAGVRLVVGGDVGAHEAAQLHPGARAQRRVVGEQRGRAAATEEAVGEHHGLVGSRVPVGRDGLGRDDQCQRVPPRAQRVAGQVQRDQPRAAAHAREVVRRHVVAHAVPRHDPRRQGRRRGEHGHIDHQHVHVPRAEPGLGEELRDGLVEDGVHLVERVPVRGGVLAVLQHVGRAIGLLTNAGPDDDAEQEAVLRQAQPLVALDDGAGHLRGYLAVVRRLVANVVQQVATRPAAALVYRPGEVGHLKEEERRQQREQIHHGNCAEVPTTSV